MKNPVIGITLVVLLCGLCVLSIRCHQRIATVPAGEDIPSARISGSDYRIRGKYAVLERDSVLALPGGCSIPYTLHTPESMPAAPWILLGHGFMRSRESMRGLASHWASWGMRVASLDFCRSSWIDGNHVGNGQDMIALGEALHTQTAIYAGFSAGGLSALVAAADDAAAIACLGLDLVDVEDTGTEAAFTLDIPLFGLASEPSACNAWSGGTAAYRAAKQAILLQVEDATHCHFEIPFDPMCPLVCGSGEEEFDRDQIQESILAFSTAFLMWQSGLDPGADGWWSPEGENFQLFAGEGRMSRIDLETE